MGTKIRSSSSVNRAIACAMAVLLLVALMPVAPAQAIVTTWYVDVATGSDGNPGTAGSPFKTITAGLAAASEGDTVQVAPGTYRAGEQPAIGVAIVIEGEQFPLVVPTGVTVVSAGGPDVTIIDGEGGDRGLYPMAVEPAIEPMSGSLLLIEQADGVTVSGFTFTGGSTFAGGGAAVFGSDDVVFEDVIFDGNRAYIGGGMVAVESSVRLAGCSFLGTGDYFDGDDELIRPKELENGLYEPGFEALYGGGLAAIGSDMELWDCEFIGNTAWVLGAGALFEACTVEVDGGWVENGYVIAGGPQLLSEQGEAFEFPEPEVGISWSDEGASIQEGFGFSFEENIGGGFAFLASEATVGDVWFSGNGAPRGGAIFADQLSSLMVSESTFADNFAIWGAGVLFDRFDPMMNQQAEAGIAGIELQEGHTMPDPSLSIEKSVFEYNDADTIVATQSEYGMFGLIAEGHDEYVAPVSIVNSLFNDNRAWNGVVNAQATDIMNCTFADNVLGGMLLRAAPAMIGPIPFYGSSTVVIDSESSVINSVLWGNGIDEFDYDFELDGPSIQDYDGPVDVMGGYVAYTNAEHFIAAYETGDGNISEDPMFVEPMWSDYRLRPGSPSIDTGTNSDAPLEDLLGRPRPYDGNLSGQAVTDMGAYEYRPEKAVRLGGADRYGTSVRISRENFDFADTVLIARGDDFADGLTASGLAGLYGAPLLLTRSDSLPSEVAAEIKRLGASEAIIVGGRRAVGDGVRSQLQALGLMVDRVAGADRYQTAERIASRIAADMGDPEVVFLVRGDEFPDALAVSPVAYAQHAPILLVRPADWPSPGIGVSMSVTTTVYIAGGEAAVSELVEESVKSTGVEVERIAGDDRFDTAARFAKRAVSEGWASFEYVGMATGHDFPDALTGGAAIGSKQGVLLLTPTASLHPSVERILKDNKASVRKVEVFGGPAALSRSVMESIQAAIGPRS